MTFGQKLKDARLKAGFTQEEAATRLAVSRQAVSKWEGDKGLPDIENLKAISQLLGVSLDYLLDNDTALDMSVTRQAIVLSDYGKGRKKPIKDKVVRSFFPDAEIMTLLKKDKLTKSEKVVDAFVDFLTPLCNVMDITKSLNNLENEYYLVNDGDSQYFVLVSNEFIESHRLAEKITDQKFEIGNSYYLNCGKITYA